jgi:hypothetical protein
MKHKSTVVGEMIAFSKCNKPFKPLGILKGQVKSRESLPIMIPINISSTILFENMSFHTNTWSLPHKQI